MMSCHCSRAGCAVVAGVIALLFTAVPVTTAAQTYPTRPIRLIVPFPAGGPVDATARVLGPRLSEAFGQPVVIDNRAGAATIIATELVAKSPPDGHTLLLVTSGIAINPHIYRKLPYDTLRDLAPITLVMTTPFILIAHPALPVRTAGDLVKLAKARPGELMYASSGIGGANHLAGAQFDMAAGIRTTHVPYKGTTPGITDLMAGNVQFQFSNPLGSLQFVRAGRLRALGVASMQRLEMMPELPTVSESGVPGFQAGVWFGLYTTAGTAREIVGRIHVAVARILALPDVKQKLAAGGAEIRGSTPEAFAAFFLNEVERHARLVKAAGIEQE
jgi:tripartite-type tricarboxylate transporter receptor subunit TctC